MESSRQYNLRSQKSSTLQVPVQIDTPANLDLFERLLKSCDANKKSNGSESSDISDLDCSGLLNVSDDSNVAADSKPDPVHNQSSCFDENQATTSSNAMTNSQDLINREILQQLQTIGKRLDTLETKNCKKITDLKKSRAKVKPKGHSRKKS